MSNNYVFFITSNHLYKMIFFMLVYILIPTFKKALFCSNMAIGPAV